MKSHVPSLNTAILSVRFFFGSIKDKNNEDDFKLIPLSQIIVPDLLRWALGGHIDSNTRHPLCIATMLQFLFTLLTKTQSLHCLDQSNGISSENSLRQIFKLSVDAIGTRKTDVIEEYARSTMRITALKLLLIIMNIDQSSPTAKIKSLTPGDIAQALSTIRGVANVDESTDVRKLASYLVNALQCC